MCLQDLARRFGKIEQEDLTSNCKINQDLCLARLSKIEQDFLARFSKIDQDLARGGGFQTFIKNT